MTNKIEMKRACDSQVSILRGKVLRENLGRLINFPFLQVPRRIPSANQNFAEVSRTSPFAVSCIRFVQPTNICFFLKLRVSLQSCGRVSLDWLVIDQFLRIFNPSTTTSASDSDVWVIRSSLKSDRLIQLFHIAAYTPLLVVYFSPIKFTRANWGKTR